MNSLLNGGDAASLWVAGVSYRHPGSGKANGWRKGIFLEIEMDLTLIEPQIMLESDWVLHGNSQFR